MLYNVTILSKGQTTTLSVEENARLLDVLTENGFPIGAPCGGRCFCGKCRVIAHGSGSPMTEAEARFFTEEERENGWRLACGCHVQGEMTVELPDESAAKIVTESQGTKIEFDSDCKLLQVQVAEPSLADQRGDDIRLMAALEKEYALSPKALRHLPAAVRAETTYVLLRGEEIVDVSAEPMKALGVAVDIGTTTIAAYLLDLLSGEKLATASRLNPQRNFGADVISRADYARTGEETLLEEANCVRNGLREMTQEMLKKTGLPEDAVLEYAIVGNTIMQHLFLALTPEHIAVTPFIPAYTQRLRIAGREVGLVPDDARVTMMPCVAGYVGADTIAAILSCDMDQSEGVSLLLDIGTNGEIALGGKDRMVCCSAAAGPAFEGAHIQFGMGAVAGAIDHVKVENNEIHCTTIGNTPAKGICGSGLVDAIAQLLDAAIIDETGRIDEDEAPDELITDFDGKCAVPLTENVLLCQKDVREVQLAKGAIAAGIEILMKELHVTTSDIRRVYLAGGFGSFISKESACRIGLLPEDLLEKIESIGNAAGSGAQKQLLNRATDERAEALRKRLSYIELSAQADFQELFAEMMLFE